MLSAEDTAHMRSLRMRPTELFVVCDGAGSDHICRLARRDGGTSAEIVETRPSVGEPTIACSVFIAYAKGDRLDYAVQKSVELGACEVVLFPSERCVSVPVDLVKKAARFQRIALETAKQSGRGRVPGVTATRSFAAAVKLAARAGLPLFLYEDEATLHLKQALEDGSERLAFSVMSGPEGAERAESTEAEDSRHDAAPNTVSVMSGPEGGFVAKEAELARSAGMRIVTLGPRILRCETAPVAALAAVMYHTCNL